MKARYFADYVNDLKSSGALSIETAALVCHGEAEIENTRTFDTAMGHDVRQRILEPNRPSFVNSIRASEPGPAPVLSLLELGDKPANQNKPSLSAMNDGDPLKLVFPLAKRPGNAFDHISVGRTDTVDVVLPLLQVSKFHAYFSRDTDGQFTLADAGSKNGTWIGTRRLSVRSPEPVRDGARIRLGPYVFTFLTRTGFLNMVTARAGLRAG